MGDIVQLRSPIDINSDLGRAFIVDATRAGEGLITDQELQEKYELSPADWLAITKDKAIGRAVRSESERRVRNGSAAREAAAKHFVKAPAVLDQIMTDADSNPRHKIEAIKELRATANGGSEKGPAPGEAPGGFGARQWRPMGLINRVSFRFMLKGRRRRSSQRPRQHPRKYGDYSTGYRITGNGRSSAREIFKSTDLPLTGTRRA